MANSTENAEMQMQLALDACCEVSNDANPYFNSHF